MFAFPLLAGPHGPCRGDTPSCASTCRGPHHIRSMNFNEINHYIFTSCASVMINITVFAARRGLESDGMYTKASHARRARPRSIRSTLISLMVIPLISLVALWAYAATSTIGGAFAQRAYDTENRDTGGPGQALLLQLVQERTLTYVWLSTGRKSSPAAMEGQRAATDAAIAKFRSGVAAAGGALSQLTRQDLTLLFAKLNSLGGIRAAASTAASTAAMGPLAVFQAYNAIVDADFQFFRSEAVVPNGSIALYQ